MAAPYRVFWQPGCSSCLKAKEFLTGHGIPFDSVNVLADGGGMQELQALGAKSVPVVSKGDEFVFAQNLGDLADFVGVARAANTLSPTELVARLDRILAVAQSHACQLPEEALATPLPGRDRTYLDLAYHIFVIAEAFLAAANGGMLVFEYFERRPPATMTDGSSVAGFGDEIRKGIQAWWQSTEQGKTLPAQLQTYYGEQTVPDLLERTTWHAAQHTRQLEAVLENHGIVPRDALTEGDLEGLPLPSHVYDDEVSLTPEIR